MRLKILVTVLSALALLWAAESVQAGAIRFAGKEIKKGSAPIATAAANGAGAAVGGMAAAGAASGSVVKTGAVGAAKGAKSSPSVLAHGAKAAAKGIWKVIW